MKGIYKYGLIALIAFALGAFTSSKYLGNREPEVIVEVDTVYVEKSDSTGIVFPQDKVEVAHTSLVLPSGSTLPNGEILTEPVEVDTNKYTGVEKLENGTIEFEIYADNLLAYDFKLTTNEKIVTKTVTKTLPAKSRLYLMGGADVNLVTKSPTAVELGLMYNRRQKWGVGLSIRHDFSGIIPPEYSTTLGGNIYIGL